MSSTLKRKRFRKSGRPMPKASFPISKRDLLQKIRKQQQKKRNPLEQSRGPSLLAAVSSQPPCNQLSPSRDCTDTGLTFSSPAELFRSLIDPITPEVFFADYWEKKPLLLKRGASSSCPALFSLSDLLQIVEKHSILFGTHVNVCRYVNHWRQSLNREGRLTAARLRKLWNEKKATLQFHQPQQFKDILWRVLSHLESYFCCLVGSNVYLTPAGSQGLAPHYDDVEVFILQLEGCKHWRLYRPPVELPQTCSHDLSQEEIGEPTHDFVLEAGDLLYFPRGTVHQADTPTHTPHSTHITISTYQNHSWSTLLGHLLDHALQQATSTDPDFRRGLPLNLLNIPGGAAPPEGNYPMGNTFASTKDGGNLWSVRLESLKEKAKSLVMQLSEHLLDVPAALESISRDFIASRLPPYSGSEELGPQGPLPDLQALIQPTWPDYTYLSTLSSEPDNGEGVEPGTSGHTHQQWVVVLHSLCNQRGGHMTGAGSQPPEPTGVRLPLHYKEALEMLFVPPAAEAIPVSALPLVANDDKKNLAVTLWAEGLVRVTPN